MDRSELLSTYAENLLSPPIPELPEKAEGGVSVEELVLNFLKAKAGVAKRGTADAERYATTGITNEKTGKKEKI